MTDGYRQTLRVGEYAHPDTGTLFFFCDECGRTIGQMTQCEVALKPDKAVLRIHRQMDEHAITHPECQNANPKSNSVNATQP
jgi:hypothetical protein